MDPSLANRANTLYQSNLLILLKIDAQVTR